MKKIIKNQDGFGVIEIILVVVVVGLVGFIGWNAYHQRHKAASTSTPSTSTTPTSQAKTNPTTATKPEVSYVTVKEWGVKVPEQPQGSAISYQISANDSNTADFVSSEQKALGGSCGTFTFARYHVFQANAGYKSRDDVFQNKLNYASQNSLTVKANNKTYYILGDMSGGDCTGTLKEGQSVSQQEVTSNNDLLNDLKGLVSAN